jgi:hypothetical protein
MGDAYRLITGLALARECRHRDIDTSRFERVDDYAIALSRHDRDASGEHGEVPTESNAWIPERLSAAGETGTIPGGVMPYVWQDEPTEGALRGYQGALVRAANGVGVTNPQGFNFAANYRHWAGVFGDDVIWPWTYLYPSSNGATAARALYGAAGLRGFYQVDLEDAVPPATIRAFCDTLHQLAPGCQIIFDSYPTRAQFVRVNGSAGAATWDQAVHSFDGFCPQVYYSSQLNDGWEDEFGGKPITPAFSPSNYADWGYFQRNLDRFGAVRLWRYTDSNNWQGRLAFQAQEVDEMSQADAEAAIKNLFHVGGSGFAVPQGYSNLVDVFADLINFRREFWTWRTQTLPAVVAALVDKLYTHENASGVAVVDGVIGYLAAHPATAEMSEADKQALLDGFGQKLQDSGITATVDEDRFFDALSVRLAS